MDKWTRSLLDSGYSNDFQWLMANMNDGKKLHKWAEAKTDDTFGPVFSLAKIPHWLELEPLIARKLKTPDQTRYRQICAAALMTNEMEIPVLFLMFKEWGVDSMKDYLATSIKKNSKWSYLIKEWTEGIAAVQKVNLPNFSGLDEPSKLLLFVSAKKGGRISRTELPKQRLSSFTFLKEPTLEECVSYTLEDIKSSDLSLLLKSYGLKQSGKKSDKIDCILTTLTTEEIANSLKVSPGAYLHLFDTTMERDLFCQATLFLYDISAAAFSLDLKYVHNRTLINEAMTDGSGIRLHHHAKCPVHRKNVFQHHELNLIDPIAHPDCDAAFLSFNKK